MAIANNSTGRLMRTVDRCTPAGIAVQRDARMSCSMCVGRVEPPVRSVVAAAKATYASRGDGPVSFDPQLEGSKPPFVEAFSAERVPRTPFRRVF
jgi:hypothetical protein